MTYREEMKEILKAEIGDGSVYGDAKMYRRWWSFYRDEAKAAERIAGSIESRLERLTPLDSKSTIHPWTEHEYADKEQDEKSLQRLLDTFGDYLGPVNRELARYEKNLLEISKTYSRLQTAEARKYYRHGELKKDMVYQEGLQRRDEIVKLMRGLRPLLTRSYAMKFPGNKQPKNMHDQVEDYPIPVPPTPTSTPILPPGPAGARTP